MSRELRKYNPAQPLRPDGTADETPGETSAKSGGTDKRCPTCPAHPDGSGGPANPATPAANPEAPPGPAVAANWPHCRFYLAYVLALLIFSGLALLFLPNLKEVAAALGAAEALGTLGQPPDLAAQTPLTEAWDDLMTTDPRFQGVLPEITSLAGLLVLGKISLGLAPLLLALGLWSLLARPKKTQSGPEGLEGSGKPGRPYGSGRPKGLYGSGGSGSPEVPATLHLALRLGLWLGLGHSLFAALLLGRAAYALLRAPDFYLTLLSGNLQNFAVGGYVFWLGGVALLLALLWLARHSLRAVQIAPRPAS